MSNNKVPAFVVVGRTNEGKSSVVSTLIEDDSVLISPIAGTTVKCKKYYFKVGEETLFELIDTPGFEQERYALEWMKNQNSNIEKRKETVRKFVQTFSETAEFKNECELLKPVLNGAAILYIVDSSLPFRKKYEAEMEILQWSGQPRIALINQKRENDYSDDWKLVLDQYFRLTRHFNAHKSGFPERLSILKTLSELNDEWTNTFEKAGLELLQIWNERRDETVRIFTKNLIDLVTFYIEVSEDEFTSDSVRQDIELKFHEKLRKKELRWRRSIEVLYNHKNLMRNEEQIDKPELNNDLFAKETWKTMGLTPTQLIAASTIAGTVVGAAADFISVGAGALAGGILGASTAIYNNSKRIISIKQLKDAAMGKKIWRIGPHNHRNFPFILLDRALSHYHDIVIRSHACRDKLIIPRPKRIIHEKYVLHVKKLSNIFDKLRTRFGNIPESLKTDLHNELNKIIIHFTDTL